MCFSIYGLEGNNVEALEHGEKLCALVYIDKTGILWRY